MIIIIRDYFKVSSKLLKEFEILVRLSLLLMVYVESFPALKWAPLQMKVLRECFRMGKKRKKPK